MYIYPKTDWSNGDNAVDTVRAFNRIEGNTKALVKDGITFTNTKTFSDGIETEKIDGSPTLNGYEMGSVKTANIAGYGNFTFSASDINSSHLTNKSDSLLLDWFYEGDTSLVFYSHYLYSGSTNDYKFLMIKASQGGRAGATSCNIRVVSADPPETVHISIGAFAGDLGPFGSRYYYAALPPEAPDKLKLIQSIDSPTGTALPRGADIRIRRCKYPIQPGNPVKVFSSDFSTTQKRAITATDIRENRLSS